MESGEDESWTLKVNLSESDRGEDAMTALPQPDLVEKSMRWFGCCGEGSRVILSIDLVFLGAMVGRECALRRDVLRGFGRVVG